VKTYIKYSLIGWIVIYVLITAFLYPISDLTTALVRAGSFLVPQMILFFLNLIWLSCSYLEQGKKLMYFGLITLFVGIYVIIFGPVDIYLNEAMPLDVEHLKNRPLHVVYVTRLMSAVPPIIVSALIWKSHLLRRKTEESLELKNKMLDAEAKALKAQINPHFLFNSMNNIYSLSQIQSDKTGDAILQLSEILRFITYDSEKDKVSLEDELKQIKNFIELQFLKDDDQSNVKVDIDENAKNLQIAPMLLLPFIENSFKHSNFEDKVNGWINISIKVQEDSLLMLLKNSASLTAVKKDETGGVGMENVKKRLSLIYPDEHTLSIKQDSEKYTVELNLKLT
jgi:hypothetical protein